MRKYSLVRALYGFSTAALLLPPFVVFAQKDTLSPVAEQVLLLFNVLTTIVFIGAILIFGWGILLFITGSNDPASVAKSKGFLLWGVIGIAVAASLLGLITFLQSYFGVRGGRLIVRPPEVMDAGGTTGGGTVGGGSGGTVVQPPPPPPPPGGAGSTTRTTP